MDLLERIFGVETMARVREAAREAQARANAVASVPAGAAPRAPAVQRPVAPVPRAGPVASVRSSLDDSLGDVPAAEFPTSILGTEDEARPPLLAAFASRDALLGAIIYSEALAPPVALR